jgi:hypothetical protein
MPRITTVDLAEARSRLRGRAPGYDARAPYREAIANLTAARALELTAEEGESIRRMRLNLSRAAKEVNRQIAYGLNDEGQLIVWLEAAKPTRRPRKKAAAGAADLVTDPFTHFCTIDEK